MRSSMIAIYAMDFAGNHPDRAWVASVIELRSWSLGFLRLDQRSLLGATRGD